MKIVTWNILAQRYYKEIIYTWESRLHNIITILKSFDADIICLQEVEIASFSNDFKILIENRYNFYGHEIFKKRKCPIGCFILVKTNLEIKEVFSTSAAVIVNIPILGRIANIHLRSGSKGKEDRERQLNSILKYSPDIIIGDFNDSSIQIDGYEKHNYKVTCFSKNRFGLFDNIYTRYNYIVLIDLQDITSITEMPNNSNPSDHIPLYITINKNEIL